MKATLTGLKTLTFFMLKQVSRSSLTLLVVILIIRQHGKTSLFGDGDCLYELLFLDGRWQKNKIHDLGPLWRRELKGGEGHNDGIYRLYFPFGIKIYEMSFSGDSWIETDTIDFDMWICGLSVGPGRGDGINRIYVGEYEWLSGNYKGTFELTFRQ